MPKRPKEHGYDGLATDTLREILPKIWIYKSVKDVFSGFEYGEDWLIEIVDDQEKPTGIEFCVQNKVTSRIGKKTISVEIEVATLHHLHELGRPILIHIHSLKTDKSYWMWLEDFYAKNSTKWRGKKRVSIPLPIENVLDGKSVEQIYSYADTFHKRQSFVKRNTAISRTDPDYRLELILNDNKDLVVIHPKHDNPRPITVTFHDAEAAKQFRTSIETGTGVEVTAGIYLEGIIEHERGELKVFQNTPNESFPQKIEMLSDKGEKLYEIPYLNMKLIQAGSILHVWQGKLKTPPVVVTMTHDERVKEFQINFEVDQNVKNPIDLQSRYAFVDCVIDTSVIRLTNLEDGVSVNLPQQHIVRKNFTTLDDDYRKLVSALAKIAERLDFLIEVPDEFSYDDLETAQDICKILDTGLNTELNKYGTLFVTVAMMVIEAEKLLENPSTPAQEIFLHHNRHETVELLGHQIALGPAELAIYGKEVDLDDLRERINTVKDRANDTVEIRFSVDGERSFIKYLNWFKDTHSPL